MAQRIVLAVAAEFLRLLLRQLLREQPNVEIIGDFDSLTEGLKQRGAHGIIVDAMACAIQPSAVAEMSLCYPGRIMLVGEGSTVPLPRGLKLREVTLVPAGSEAASFDLSAFASRLKTALDRQHAAPLQTSAPLDAPSSDVIDISPGVVRLSRRPAVIAVATSTGGPEALKELLGAIDPPVCPIIIALHIPREHTAGMAAHLAAMTSHAVTVGESGPLRNNAIILLQGGADFAVTRSDGGFCLQRIHGYDSVFHPNGTVLLTSIAGLHCPVAGIVLTGMGDDGCLGARDMKACGYPVLAQRPSTCAVPGMPNAAIAAGAVTEVASLLTIAERLNRWFVLPP
jgi:two-component system, chemotaxis family, protein-glutamate methylesterase/glutaminase